MAGDGEGAAGIGEFEARRPVLARQPALQQARHEAVTGAEHIEDFDRETLPRLALIKAFGNGTLEDDGAHRPALAHQRGAADSPHRLQGRDRIGRTACNMEFLFRSDDEIEERQRRLQLGGDGGGFDKAALAIAVAGQAPEIGAIVNVERGL